MTRSLWRRERSVFLRSRETSADKPKARYFTPGRIARRLLLLGIYLGICTGIAWGIVSPRHTPLTSTPEQYKLSFESVRFSSWDGTSLAGWFIPAPAKPRGAIILCHGIGGTRESMLLLAATLHQSNYATLLFDFRARGESGGSRCTIGYRETDDLLAAIGYVRSRSDMQQVPLGILGDSQGGAVALMGAAR